MDVQESSRSRPVATVRRIRRLLLAGAILLAVALVYHWYWLARPVGHGPAGPLVPREAFEKSWSAREVFLLGLGDSVTAGFGSSLGLSYFDRLIANPPDEFSELAGISLKAVLPKLRFRNASISGSVSLEHLGKQIPRIEVFGSNVVGIVVITTGGNDIIHNYGRTPPAEGAMYGATFEQARPWITNFEQRLETMLGLIRGKFPGGCQIFLANIYDPTDGAGDVESAGLPAWRDGMEVLKAYNEVIARVAARQPSVHLVEMRGEFLGHGIHAQQFWRKTYRRGDPRYWYHDNLEDPNDRGYDAIRRLFLNAIAAQRESFR